MSIMYKISYLYII